MAMSMAVAMGVARATAMATGLGLSVKELGLDKKWSRDQSKLLSPWFRLLISCVTK